MKIFWIFVEQGKIMGTEEPTVRVGAIPSELTAPPTPITPPGKIIEAEAQTVPVDATPTETNGDLTPKPPPYYAGCPSCCITLPVYSGLGQAPIYAGLHTRWIGYW